MKSLTNHNQQKSFRQVLLGTAALLLAPSLVTPLLPVQALAESLPVQSAKNSCILYVSTSTSSYGITVCQEADKNIYMVLSNQKTGERLRLPAIQVDDAGNVFRASVIKREKQIVARIPIAVTQVTTYVLNIPQKQFAITKEVKTPGNRRKFVQVEQLGFVLMSSSQHGRMA